MSAKELRQNPMMCHLMDSLEAGKDVGHYGRLVFAIVARHFLGEKELTAWLCKSPDFSEDEARALVMQVRGHDYSPPRPEKIMEWQSQQEFPICPGRDRDSCNVYHNLKFPDGVYHHITEYYEQKVQ